MPKYLMAEDRRKLRRRLCEAQNWRCCYCGIVVSDDKEDANKPFYATFDHVTPQATYANSYSERWYHRNHYDKHHWNYNVLVIACGRCNSIRLATDAFAFSEGQLWKPENKLALKLYRMRADFMSRGCVGTLKAMGSYCCGCQV